jgi:two-component system sensor histidine kinase/response regulator
LFEDLKRFFLPVFSKKPHIEFRTILQHDKLFNFIQTDESRLKQVLINLINNALSFTNKGYIEIGYQIVNNSYLKFYVSDTGSGIPQAHQNHLFDRFVQSNPALAINEGGSGLSLPISRGIIELMGGKIWIKTLPGIGSHVYFTIPYLPTRINIENIN